MKTEARCLRDFSRWEEKGGCCETHPVLYSRVEARANGKMLLSLLPPPVFWFQSVGRTGVTSRGNLCKHHTQGPPSTERYSLPKPRPAQHNPGTVQLQQRWSRRPLRRSSRGARGQEAQSKDKRTGAPWYPRRGRPDTQTGPSHDDRTSHSRGCVLR